MRGQLPLAVVRHRRARLVIDLFFRLVLQVQALLELHVQSLSWSNQVHEV